MYGLSDAMPNADEVLIKRKLLVWLLNVAKRSGVQYEAYGYEKLQEIEECLK